MKSRRMMVMAVVVAASALVFGGESYAQGRGAGAGAGMMQGIHAGTGGTATYNICDGTSQAITGKVVNFGWPINGLEISTGAATNTTVYGVGPYWYWDSKNIDMPEIGEPVTAVVSAVTVSTEKVILSLTLGADTIQLRDTATCQPLWRGGRR